MKTLLQELLDPYENELSALRRIRKEATLTYRFGASLSKVLGIKKKERGLMKGLRYV